MKIISFIICAFAITQVFGQNLPAEWHISSDGKRLVAGTLNKEGSFYDSTLVQNVNLQFSQTNYWTLLTNNYKNKIELPATMTLDGKVFEGVGVRFKGNTSYNNVQNKDKKSFNVTLDYTDPSLDVDGYSTLNFNNSFEDKSFLREVFYLHQIRKHIPAAKANYIHLSLNGLDWGLYPNVQQINKDFYKEWFKNNDGANWRADTPTGAFGGPGGGGMPGWGDGTAGLNYLGNDTLLYQKYYTLKYSEIEDPWTKLVKMTEVLKNTPVATLPDELPKYLDIDKTLWFLACEIIFGDDDSYIWKGKMDYYVYLDEATKQFSPIEFDGNSAFFNGASTWGVFYNESNVNYPLLNIMLKVPEWRQRYLAHFRTILQQSFDPTVCNTMIDNYKNQIDALVQSDPKKLYTYAQFNSEITSIKTWIKNRNTFLKSNAEVNVSSPEITDVNYSSPSGPWTAPKDDEFVTVTAQASHTNGIKEIVLLYDNSLYGEFTPTLMADDGLHSDGVANDGIYGATIPAQEVGKWVRFYIEARANNNQHTVSYSPVGAEHDVYIYQIAPRQSSTTSLVINEFMASNVTIVKDESGSYADWIELYNTTNEDKDVSGFYLTDTRTNPDKWKFAQGTIIPAYSYFIVWADEDSKTDSFHHCNFKLSKSGEELFLFNNNLEILDSIVFGEQQTDLSYARSPNGYGSFKIKEATFNGNNDVNLVINPDKQHVVIYPSPAIKGFTIRTNTNNDQPYEIYTIFGQSVDKGHISDEKYIDALNWSSGLYIISVGEYVQKIELIREE